MSDNENRMPVVAPIELVGEHLDRYLEIRMLRMLFDPSGHRPIGWNETGQVVPGQWNMRPHKTG